MKTPSRILVLCRHYLGDLVLSGPVFRNLRAWVPDAFLASAIYPENAEPLTFFDEIDEIIAIPRRRLPGQQRPLAGWLSLLRRVRRERFDLVYDLMQTERSLAVLLASGAPQRVGYVRRQPGIRHRFYTHAADWRADLQCTHMVELFLRPLAEIGMPIRTRSTRVSVTPTDAAEAAARLDGVLAHGRGPLVLVHPGAGTTNRTWQPERFAAVCDTLQAEGARVLLLGGPREAGALEEIGAVLRNPVPRLEGKVSVRQLAALLEQADLFVGIDSGPAHLAAAVGTQAVVLFGAALPAQWRPLGEEHVVVRPEMPCPCIFPELCRPPNPDHTWCTRRILVDAVLSRARSALWDDKGPAGGGELPG